MVTRRLWLPLALLLGIPACREATAPPSPVDAGELWFSETAAEPLHILRQSPIAPRLTSYRVSFWARRGTQTTLFLNYRPATGQTRGDPFLRFQIPINGLVAGAGGVPLDRGDSVLITLTIDTVRFLIDFQPSGVVFSRSSPAKLAIWYQDADPDLNADGVVDATDQALQQLLAIWSEERYDAWRQLSTRNDTTQQYVASEVHHFSQYAVSW